MDSYTSFRRGHGTEPAIAASLLGANHARLHEAAVAAARAGADYLHVDVMDGSFVPNLAFGPGVVEGLRDVGVPIIAHLMVQRPEDHLESFITAGAHCLTFHLETTAHPHRVLTEIRRLGALAGLALNPGTPLNAIEQLAGDIDLLLIMTVNPGFGGQKFIPSMIHKIKAATTMLAALGSQALLEVDGGITAATAGVAAEAGASILAAGSSLFAGNDVCTAMAALRQAAKQGMILGS